MFTLVVTVLCFRQGINEDDDEWDDSLAMAEAQLREAAAKVVASNSTDHAAQREFNTWGSRVTTHPEFIAREREELARWHAENESKFEVPCQYRASILAPPAEACWLGTRTVRCG